MTVVTASTLFLGGLLLVAATLVGVAPSQEWLWIAVGAPLAVLLVRRLSYLDPIVGFLAPWTLVTCFLLVDLTKHSRTISAATLQLLLTVFSIWILVAGWTTRNCPSKPNVSRERIGPRSSYPFLVAFYLAFTVLNFALAGYVPIIRLLQTGSSDYFDFGVRGLYGLYNAYSNALGLLSFILYLEHRRREYLILFVVIIAIFTACVSRQNVVSLLCESLVAYAFIRRPLSLPVLAGAFLVILAAFAAFGELRSGDIRFIAGVRPEYEWVPKSFVWPYSYGYFNVLNLDNVVVHSSAPLLDGSSVATLVPSFARSEFNHPSYLELPQFTVSSFLLSTYLDIGFWGSALWTAIAAIATARAYRRALERESFFWVATYSVLFFCAAFSFFINFWTYLPIIFQIPFFWLFQIRLTPRYEPQPAMADPSAV